MKAALLGSYHRPLELVERPEPEPAGSRDVVVRIGGAGVCATDLHAIDGLMEPAGLTLPVVLGHENAGWVHAVGDGVTAAAVGDAVLLYPPYSCGLCVPCRRGLDMHCERHGFTGLTRDGGFAEYVLVDERSLVRLPAGVEPAAVAPHSDAGITAYHAVKKLVPRLVPGTTAALIGVGGVGHIALQLLRVLGAGVSVVAIDTDERRRRLARELGADEVLGEHRDDAGAVRELTDGVGADVVLDCVGTDETHAAGLEMLARRGLYSIVGYGGTVSVPSDALVVGETAIEANLVGSWIDLWELLQLHGRGDVTLRTETHPLDEVNDVLDRLREGEITGRAVLVP
jgi:NAD+-dependent secondary alcohol dehydrogenase Adh1